MYCRTALRLLSPRSYAAYNCRPVMLFGTTRTLASSSSEQAVTDNVSNKCDLHLVRSPYPDIAEPPYPPLYEFVTQNWKKKGKPDGYLDDKVAIVDGSTGAQRTFADHYQTTTSLAAALQKDMGLQEDSTVALYCPNHVDYLSIALAVSLTGAKMTPINPLYTSNELSKVLVASRASVLVVHASKLDVALETLQSMKEHNHVKHFLVIHDDEDVGKTVPEGTVSLEQLRHAEKEPHEETIHVVHKNMNSHICLLPYSSGTTGLPKGVCLSHQNIVSNLLQLDEVEGLAFSADHKLISPLPFFHIYAFTVSLLYTAWKGQTLITMSKRFDLERYCQLVEAHKPERTHLVPPILLGLGKSPVVDKYDLSSLRMIVSAAAPMGTDTEVAVKERIGCEVKQIWGMSELSPVGTQTSDFHIKSGSVGPVAPSTVAKIIDSNGMSVGPNVPGELLIKGPQVMMGYLNDPERTDECLCSVSGWLRTGDVAHFDEDGFCFITDRIKELIKVRGFQVAPAELEDLLLTHEAVGDCAVIQIPDEASGEVPRAYIVLKHDAKDVDEDSIYQWVKDRVAPYKRLDGGVVFVDKVPKSASGKILRRVLRDQVAAETGGQ